MEETNAVTQERPQRFPKVSDILCLLFKRGGRLDYNKVRKGVMIFLSGN